MKISLVIALFIGFVSVSFAEEQWDFSKSVKPLSVAHSRAPTFKDSLLARIVVMLQKSISEVDGDRCSLYPTCSAYSAEAFQRHGLIIGFVMTAGRLIQELDEAEISPRVAIGNQFRGYDSVSRNDFWWHQKDRY